MIEFKDIIKKANKIADRIEEARSEIEPILLEYESYDTFKDEFNKSIQTLRNLKLEEQYFNKKVNIISVFAPINLPLFSLVIYAIVPGFMSNKVVIRPPITLQSTCTKLLDLLKYEDISLNIELNTSSRNEFASDVVAMSDVVIFTGKPENVRKIIEFCKDSTLFIYEGIGLNPILITKSANLDLAVSKTIQSRIFNSGQDCAGADGIIIHKEVAGVFIQKLIEQLKLVKVGNYKDKQVKIGKIIEDSQILFSAEFLNKNKSDIVYGGDISFKENIVYPTIIRKNIKIERNFKELFTPTFYIMEYDLEEDLDLYFQDTNFIANTMYVSVFGNTKYTDKIKNSTILNNQIVLDIENGNSEYGGYSKNSSFVRINKQFIYKPILISREISTYL